MNQALLEKRLAGETFDVFAVAGEGVILPRLQLALPFVNLVDADSQLARQLGHGFIGPVHQTNGFELEFLGETTVLTLGHGLSPGSC